MSYFPDDIPLPSPTPDDQPYWDACRRRELRLQQCASCGRFRHPPMPVCFECGSTSIDWTQVSGEGSVFSYTTARHPVHPGLRDAVPYNIAVVLLDDADDVRLVSNVVDADPEEMHIGMPVSLIWDATSDGGALPRFRKRSEARP